jgi:HEAT repeat protein
MEVTETTAADVAFVRDELLQLNQVIALTERTAEQAEDDFPWRLSLQGFCGLRQQRLDELVAAAHAGSEPLQRAAVRALGKVGGEDAIPALVDALRSPSVNVRQEAVWALSEVGAEAVVPALAHVLGGTHAPTRQAAAWALARIGAVSAVAALAEAAGRETSAPVLAAIVAALRFVDTPEAREAAARADKLPAASQ